MILGGILAYVLLRKRSLETRMAITWLMIFALWTLFVVVTWQSAMAFATNEPTGKGWGFDPYASLKMFYLMKRGVGYYEAYFVSVSLNAGLNPSQVLTNPSSIFGSSSFFSWRGPLLFYIWILLPNGSYLYGAYVMLSSVAIVCGYLAFSKKFLKRSGILAAAVLALYFTLRLGRSWWIEWEFWGSIFSIFAFTAYFREHRIVAVLPAFFAAACKDTLAGALVGGFVGCAFRRDKRETLVWGAGIAAYAVYTIWNYLLLRQYLGVSMNVSRWLGHGGSGFVAETFRFTFPWLWGTWSWVLIVISVFGIITIRPIHLSIYAGATTLAPIIVFLLIGERWDVYWGVVYVPFVLLMIAYAAGHTCRFRTGPRSRAGKSKNYISRTSRK
jgi:hypothetical protein